MEQGGVGGRACAEGGAAARAREHPLGPPSVARGALGRAQEIRAGVASAAALDCRGQAATCQGWSGQGKARVRPVAAKLSRPFPATGDLQATGIDDSRRLCFLRREEEEEGVGKEIETLAGSRCETRDSYEQV